MKFFWRWQKHFTFASKGFHLFLTIYDSTVLIIRFVSKTLLSINCKNWYIDINRNANYLKKIIIKTNNLLICSWVKEIQVIDHGFDTCYQNGKPKKYKK